MGVPLHVRRAILFCYADRCFYCGREADSVDHIIAGDGDDPTNLIAACNTCNSTKGARPLPETVRQAARAEAWIIAPDVVSMAEQYREALQAAKRRIREGSMPTG